MAYKKVKLQLGWEFSAEEEEYYHKTLDRVKLWGLVYFKKRRRPYAKRLD